MLTEHLQRPINTYLAALDADFPSLVTALYVVGSVALDDYQERISNIDLVVVSDQPWPDAALDVAVNAQNKLTQHDKHPVVVAYATTSELAQDPRGLDLPCYEGKGRVSSDRLVNPMTWRILATRSISLRGPGRPAVSDKVEAIQEWAAGQLQTIWGPRLPHLWLHASLWMRRHVGATVLELSRLSVMAETGTVMSKTESAKAMRLISPGRFKRCLDDAAGYRTRGRMSTSMYWGALERKRDVTNLLREILARNKGRAVGSSYTALPH
jgi:hypothetical protein